MTTALTLSDIFPFPPRVVGVEWGPEWQVQVDDFHRILPEARVPGWKHRSLVVLDEVGPHCLSRVWPRIEATARDKIVVVVMQEQKLAKPRPRQYYQDRFPHTDVMISMFELLWLASSRQGP